MDIREEGLWSKDCAKNYGEPDVRIQATTLNEHQTPQSGDFSMDDPGPL